MDDESFELEDGEVVDIAAAVNDPSSSAAAADDVQLRAQLDEATQFLSQQGQPNLARLARALVDLNLRDAIWVLNDEVRSGGEFSGNPVLFDAFRRSIRGHLLNLQESGYDDEDDISAVITQLVVWIAYLAAAGLLGLDNDDDDGDATQQVYINVGAVPTSIAVVCSFLEKQTFRAGDDNKSVAEGGCTGITECSICFEEFVDGVQVSVMPCPSSSRGHRFHSDCIIKWLGISNTCPLCRYVLPAY